MCLSGLLELGRYYQEEEPARCGRSEMRWTLVVSEISARDNREAGLCVLEGPEGPNKPKEAPEFSMEIVTIIAGFYIYSPHFRP